MGEVSLPGVEVADVAVVPPTLPTLNITVLLAGRTELLRFTTESLGPRPWWPQPSCSLDEVVEGFAVSERSANAALV